VRIEFVRIPAICGYNNRSGEQCHKTRQAKELGRINYEEARTLPLITPLEELR
jgi:hypothetical protein